MRRIGILMNLAADDPQGRTRVAAVVQALVTTAWALPLLTGQSKVGRRLVIACADALAAATVRREWQSPLHKSMLVL